MSNTVFLVVDMQNDFLRPFSGQLTERLTARINDLVSFCRTEKLPIIWIRQLFKPDLSDATLEVREQGIQTVIEGTEGAEFVKDLQVDEEADTIITKKRYSAFFRTELDDVLDKLKPTGLIICGINTHACVRTTVIDAYQRDWKVYLARDCIGSYDEAHHDISLRYLEAQMGDSLSNDDIKTMFGSNKPDVDSPSK